MGKKEHYIIFKKIDVYCINEKTSEKRDLIDLNKYIFSNTLKYVII